MRCFRFIEMPLTTILTLMEFKGVAISLKHFDEIASKVDMLIKTIATDARALVGQCVTNGINLSSPEQVALLLYDTLQLPKPLAKPKQRHFSTGEEELNAIKHLHPVVQMILNHRTVAKIKSTYIDSYRSFIKSGTNTIHSIFNQTSTRTGRLSSCKPNVQQIPNDQSITIDTTSSSRLEDNNNQLRDLQVQLGLPVDDTTNITKKTTKVDFIVRSMFTARSGTVLVSADYSQIEMRVFAYVCNDQKLQNIFENKGDIYTILGGLLFKKPVELVTDAERQKAKVICLGQVYGMGADMAAAKLNISVNEAQKVFDSFFNTFHTVKEWSDMQIIKATNEGFVRTISGRRRYLPDIKSSNFMLRSAACRQAVNTIIQGSAADILKFAMIMINDNCKALVDAGHPKESIPNLLLQVHDELIYEVPISNMDNMTKSDIMSHCQPFISIIKNCMEDKVRKVLGITVPLIANVTVGSNWGEMKEYQ